MINPRSVAAYNRSIARLGRPVTIKRQTGHAPAATAVTAEVKAIVQGYTPDGGTTSQTGYGGNERGGITQGDRRVILMAADLAAQDFPLPMRKDDKVVLDGESLNVLVADAETRRAAGAIELQVVGVR